MKRPRITIEWLRTLVLAGGGLLVLAIAAFLIFGHWKRRFGLGDIPKRLGIDIQQQADGVDFTQSRKGKTLFKIHAARAVQLKANGKTQLHDVKIDLYGEDGNQTDRISGAEFDYDPSAGLAQAAGAVEITLMRPGVRPAIAPKKQDGKMPAIASQEADGEIHVKTSGLTFNQKSGIATTAQRVDFALKQGSGTSIGATYDSAKGQLVLDRSVELHVERDESAHRNAPVTVNATHAEFERTGQQCRLTQADAHYSGGEARIGDALLHFRDDGSVIKLDGSGGVDLRTATGGRIAAPRGTLDFDEDNHPRNGLLTGGAKMEMNRDTHSGEQQIQGSAPTARLLFTGAGELRHAHLETGVLFHTRQHAVNAKGNAIELQRSWESQIADVDFTAGAAKSKAKQSGDPTQIHVVPQTIHGSGGVVITSEASGVGAPGPSKLAADSVVAQLDSTGALTSLTGTGHTSFEETTAAGAHQTGSSDQLDVLFAPSDKPKSGSGEASGVASIVQQGHVVLVQEPAPTASGHTGKTKEGSTAQSPLHANAERSEYDGKSQQMHLSGSPRLKSGGLDMTANQMVFSRVSGDATATGDVKASWIGKDPSGLPGVALPGASLLGGNSADSNGPIHAIAPVAELHQASQEIIFREGPPGNGATSQPRLWQAADSISAPLITLNRQKQTIVAQTHSAANPVRTTLLGKSPVRSGDKGKAGAPSLIRLISGDLHYSEGERIAILNAGAVGKVTAETTGTGGASTIVAQQAEVHLLPAGSRSQAVRPTPVSGASNSSASNSSTSNSSASNSNVESLVAHGRVTVDWPGRKGSGEKLVYLSETGDFTLTGSAAAPPRITDQARGTVTGSALIFHSRDDSVTVEGDGRKTVTETRSPK